MVSGGPWYLSFALGFLENLFFFFKEMLGTLDFQLFIEQSLKDSHCHGLWERSPPQMSSEL